MGEVLTRDELRTRTEQAHAQGRTVAFANGCFDLLHVGHITVKGNLRGNFQIFRFFLQCLAVRPITQYMQVNVILFLGQLLHHIQ